MPTKHKRIEYEILTQIFHELQDYDELGNEIYVLDLGKSSRDFLDHILEVMGESNYNVSGGRYVIRYKVLFEYFKTVFESMKDNL